MDTKLASKSDISHNHEDWYYALEAKGITDCLTDTINPGIYIYGSDSASKPSDNGGVILTIGTPSLWTERIAIDIVGTLYFSLYQPGTSYGTWKSI